MLETEQKRCFSAKRKKDMNDECSKMLVIDQNNPLEEENKKPRGRTVPDIVAIKDAVLFEYEQMQGADRRLNSLLGEIGGHRFYEFRAQLGTHGKNAEAKEFDKSAWRYMVQLYQLEKYMLCTDYEKVRESIERYDFPEFTQDNADAWLADLKHRVHESVQKLIQDVFTRITEGTYITGSGYNGSVKKKRNNAGIDKHFILRTGDVHSLSWGSRGPTVTDDLEKACYIIDGKKLPEETIKSVIRKEKKDEGENEYFWVKFCKNGNTHYKINDKIRDQLNFYGARRGVIGEGVKIKIFEKAW